MAEVRRWVPAIILMAIIFVSSVASGETLENIGLGNETYHINGHFISFFLLGFAYYKGFKNLRLSMLSGVFYVLLNEFLQLFLPTRSFQFFDVYLGLGGLFLSGIILWKQSQILPKKLRKWLKS